MHVPLPRSRPFARTAALVVAFALVAGCNSDDDTSPGTTPDATPGAAPLVAGPVGVVELVQLVEPSVVSVATAGTGGPIGGGSGVIVRTDGVIVTNAHVVMGAETIEVAFADGVRVPARLHATDVLTDLAVLLVDREDLPAATLADGYPDVGELAVAVGNPLGFENTVTAGIVSGLQRSLPAGRGQVVNPLIDLIQTDAAISPGNSGGALLDAEGNVIGITVAYIPPEVGAVSLGFAIPAPTVASVVEDLLRDGVARHAFFGIRATTLTPQITEQLETTATRGLAVIDVEAGAPADEAGLVPGDVLVEFDGEALDDLNQFLALLRRAEPGDQVEVVIQRGDDEITLDVVLGDRPQS